MRFKWKSPMLLMSRVKGTNAKVRELTAVMDFNFAYCCIDRMVAIDLGFREVSTRPEDWRAIRADRAPFVLALRGIEMCFLLTLPEVSVGRLAAKDVDAVALKLDLPRMFPVDIILGQTFLQNFKLTVAPKAGYLSIV